jgi:hypothetical protein
MMEESGDHHSLFKGIGENHKRAFDKSQDKAKQNYQSRIDDASSVKSANQD